MNDTRIKRIKENVPIRREHSIYNNSFVIKWACQFDAYFRWIYDNYKSSVWRLSDDDHRHPRESGDIYCRKGRVQVDPNPLHIHAGLKSVASPTGIGRGMAKKESKRDHRENPDYSWRGAATAIPLCLNRETCAVWFRCLLCILDKNSFPARYTDDVRKIVNWHD